MEDQFCEIVECLLDYQAEAQMNENCGIGNDDVGLYKARDLARKYNLEKVLEKLSFGHEDDMTADEYTRRRKEKYEQRRQKQREKDSKKTKKTT